MPEDQEEQERNENLQFVISAFDATPERIDGIDGIAKVLGCSVNYVRNHHLEPMKAAGILFENKQYRKKKNRRKWITYKRLLFIYLMKRGAI